jgi:hypothetical protein
VELFNIVGTAKQSLRESNWQELEALAELDTLFDLGINKETLTLCCISKSRHEKVFYLMSDIEYSPPTEITLPNGLHLECEWKGQLEHVNSNNVFMIGLTRYPLTDQIEGKFGIELNLYEADVDAKLILPVIKRHLEEKTRDAQNRRVLSDKV